VNSAPRRTIGTITILRWPPGAPDHLYKAKDDSSNHRHPRTAVPSVSAPGSKTADMKILYVRLSVKWTGALSASKYSALRGGISRHRGYRSMCFGEGRERRASAPKHRLDEPPSYPSACCILPSPLPFHLGGHCSSHPTPPAPALLTQPAALIQLAVLAAWISACLPASSAGVMKRSHCAADGVVVVHSTVNQAPRVLRRQRCSRPDTLAFQRFVPALQLPLDCG